MEDVHDHVGIVRHDPLAGGEAVHGEWLDIVILLQRVAQFAGDGFQVWLGGAGAKDEEIRETDDATEINGDDVLGFFFRDKVGAEAG